MSQSAKPIHVGRNVSLHTPDGESVACVTVWLWNTAPLSARLLLTADQWDRVRTTEAFDIGSLSLSSELSSVESLLLDLEATDASLPTDPPVLKRRFADPESTLRSTGSWTAMGVRHHGSVSEPGGDDAAAADTPRVNDVGISMQQSRPASGPGRASSADTTERVETDGLTAALARVATELTAENRPFEASEDGTRLSLTATADHATWEVLIDDTDVDAADDDADVDVADDDADVDVANEDTDPDTDGRCLIRSVFPHHLGEDRQPSLRPALAAYSETLNRGGFVIDGSTGRVEFRTPFYPRRESTTDALTENVSSLAEWFDRLLP